VGRKKNEMSRFVRIYYYVDAFGNSVRGEVEAFKAISWQEAIALTAKGLFNSISLEEIVSGRTYARCNHANPDYEAIIGDSISGGEPEAIQSLALKTYAPERWADRDMGWIN